MRYETDKFIFVTDNRRDGERVGTERQQVKIRVFKMYFVIYDGVLSLKTTHLWKSIPFFGNGVILVVVDILFALNYLNDNYQQGNH